MEALRVLSLEILECMGFRIVAPSRAGHSAIPSARRRVRSKLSPYHPTMDAAVDAMFAPPSRGSEETGPCRTACPRPSIASARSGSARKGSPARRRSATTSTTLTAAFRRTDAMHLMWVMQAHHIDTDYYDQFFGPRLRAGARHAHGDLASVNAAPL